MTVAPIFFAESQTKKFFWHSTWHLFLLGLVFFGFGLYLNWPLGGTIWVSLSFIFLGILRYIFWIYFYGKNSFFINPEDVIFQTRHGVNKISLEDVHGIRLLPSTRNPESDWNGFPMIELKLSSGRKKKIKIGIFPSESEKKFLELNRVAPSVGFRFYYDGFRHFGWWVK
ncbi:hypothetical protein [Salinactinospora qingdaonensis]|uniref:hypothetical protein n=1 Tax=Salinactinospora qingdaonensis TaxID=702744 RepID=UPI0031EC4B6E